ncbi:MAG: amidohydrolase family protein [candidate division NC10 bacterium]|nr:amidohydrolase family protein [candidate division NC10 bacterium]
MKPNSSPNKFPYLLAALTLAAFLGGGTGVADTDPGHGQELTYVDTHNHLPVSSAPGCDLSDVTHNVLTLMDEFAIQKTLIMYPPTSTTSLCPAESLADVVERHPDRFAFLGGGESLFPIIYSYRNAPPGTVPSDTRKQFEETAHDLLRLGAVGFGELAAEHFAFHEGHPYEHVPPDHELYLLLADIAARYRVPIDLHMEAVPKNFTDPSQPYAYLTDCSGARRGDPNPPTLTENISALEHLLAHNREARIIWVHAGWDNTGYRTVKLARRLLEDHPNPYIQIRPNGLGNRCVPPFSPPRVLPNSVLDENGDLVPAWRDLIRAFPDRFTVGLDSFYPPEIPEPQVAPFLGSGLRLLRQLPPDLAWKVGTKNAVRLYNLDRKLICHKPGTPAKKTMWVSADAFHGHWGHGDELGPCKP